MPAKVQNKPGRQEMIVRLAVMLYTDYGISPQEARRIARATRVNQWVGKRRVRAAAIKCGVSKDSLEAFVAQVFRPSTKKRHKRR